MKIIALICIFSFFATIRGTMNDGDDYVKPITLLSAIVWIISCLVLCISVLLQ